MDVLLINIWGHGNPEITYKQQQSIEDVTCRQISYDHGFPKLTGARMLNKWTNKLACGVKDGEKYFFVSHQKVSI